MLDAFRALVCWIVGHDEERYGNDEIYDAAKTMYGGTTCSIWKTRPSKKWHCKRCGVDCKHFDEYE